MPPFLRVHRPAWHGRSLAFLVLLACVSVLLLARSGAAVAYPGAPWFQPSTTYTGNFADPTVVRVGGTFYAYATTTGGAYLPVETSTDLQTWTARPAYDPGAPLNADPYFNDALPYPARWAAHWASDSRLSTDVWAPGVADIAAGRWEAYYATLTRVSPARHCISVASGTSPLGPFVDRSSAPLVCDRDPAGSIDPFPFRDPRTGRWSLLWKSEGVPGHTPTRLWSRPLNASGTGFAPGTKPHLLLATARRWEGRVIESPGMIVYRGRYYLFYSANEWASASYATGYAICAGAAGPCTRATTGPLLASTRTVLGPGGPSPFVDASGHLRLAYDAWNAPYTNYPAYPACADKGTCTTQGQRRLHVAVLDVTTHGRLRVLAR